MRARGLTGDAPTTTSTGMGYKVQVLGTVFELNGTTTIADVARIDILDTDVELPDALNVTAAEVGNVTGAVNGYAAEAYEVGMHYSGCE